jgi:3-hydroxyisobutyrate dehydrogenase-like beta-hydroxyacid dehydrogenase
MGTNAMIAFSGLGRMGGAIVARLQATGHMPRLFDASHDVRTAFRERGYAVFDTLAEAASGVDYVFLCLPDAHAVSASMADGRGLLGARPLPKACVDHTSSVPSVTRRLGGRLQEYGVGMLDAPLSGGVAGAQAGTLTVMAGGSKPLLAQVHPFLKHYASAVLWAGPLGSGHAIKALNNALSALSLTATAEMLLTAQRSGMDPEIVIKAFNLGSARSQNSELKYPTQVLTRQFASGFAAGLMLKDLRTVSLMADEAKTPVPITAALIELWSTLVAELGGDADFTRIFEMLEHWD